MGGYYSKPWRTLPHNKEQDLQFVKSYRPKNCEVTQLRILLYGPVAAGRSSFINTVESTLKERITQRVPTDETSSRTVSRRYKGFKIRNGEGKPYSFIFNDIVGLKLNAECGVHMEDIKLALKGHVADDYKFDPQNPLKENDPHYNQNPTLEDSVHVLVCVIPANIVNMDNDAVKEMREVRLAAANMGIPQLAIITKVDERCPDARYIYRNKYLKQKVDDLKLLLGIPEKRIFLVKNYFSELEPDETIDNLIMYTMKHILNAGEDFINGLDGYYSRPWRKLPENKEQDLQFVISYEPKNNEVTQLRILLYGPMIAGKSSFINTVESTLKKRITERAPTDAIASGSFSRRYKGYEITNEDGEPYSFIFNDIMGLEKDAKGERGVPVEDIKLALKGHVADYYKFDPQNPLKENDPHYKPNPTLEDSVHVLVCVIPADTIAIADNDTVKKMREVRLAAADIGIPQLAIITKVDQICPDARCVYWDKELKEKVGKFKLLLGIPENRIFLVKNYVSEMEPDETIDNLIMYTMKHILHAGEDFISGLKGPENE